MSLKHSDDTVKLLSLLGLQFEDDGETWTIKDHGTHDGHLVLVQASNLIVPTSFRKAGNSSHAQWFHAELIYDLKPSGVITYSDTTSPVAGHMMLRVFLSKTLFISSPRKVFPAKGKLPSICPNEPCLFRYIHGSSVCFLLQYVDDALIAGDNVAITHPVNDNIHCQDERRAWTPRQFIR